MAQARTENRVLIFIGLLIALGLPFARLGAWGKAHSGLGPLWGAEVFWVPFFLLILLYVLLVERRPLSSLGFRRPQPLDALIGIAAAFLIIAGDIAIGNVEAIFHLTVRPEIGTMFAAPFGYRLFVVTRAAVVEEVAFRGYGLERIAELTGSKWLAAAVTFALFTFAHFPGGGLALVFPAACGGLVLTLVYLWRRNLWTAILAHWLTDAFGLLLIPAMTAHH
jgi:membrane protease YdiL (CAAX protease family)